MRRSLGLGFAGLAIILLAIALNFWLGRSSGKDEPELAAARQSPTAPQQVIRPAPEARPDGVRPSFDIVRVNPTGDSVLAGRAAPDAAVTVRDGERVVGTTTADRAGEWVLIPAEPLRPGNRELSLSARAGEAAPVGSDQAVVIVVPEPKPGTAEAGKSLALLVPREGAGASTLLQPPTAVAIGTGAARSAALPAGTDVTLDVIDYGEAGALVLGGRAAPGAQLRVYLDNALLGATAAGSQGGWQLEPGRPVEPGLYQLRVDEIGASGQVLRRIELPFSRASFTADLLGRDRLIVQPGHSLWRIARQTYGEGLRFSVIYQANREQIRDPDLIYPGQVLSLPESAAARR